MTHVPAAAVRSINSAAAERKLRGYRSKLIEGKLTESGCTAGFQAIVSYKKNKMKEVIKVVLLDELKQTLLAYEEPLKDLRDSL